MNYTNRLPAFPLTIEEHDPRTGITYLYQAVYPGGITFLMARPAMRRMPLTVTYRPLVQGSTPHQTAHAVGAGQVIIAIRA